MGDARIECAIHSLIDAQRGAFTVVVVSRRGPDLGPALLLDISCPPVLPPRNLLTQEPSPQAFSRSCITKKLSPVPVATIVVAVQLAIVVVMDTDIEFFDVLENMKVHGPHERVRLAPISLREGMDWWGRFGLHFMPRRVLVVIVVVVIDGGGVVVVVVGGDIWCCLVRGLTWLVGVEYTFLRPLEGYSGSRWASRQWEVVVKK
ncbi:hypothetical protein ARMSODRAFT_1007356 [Armillaria solidipes]|uniref:Uncharacterized protein n=1 Tax=Armillaria solidipes TaxID=1076256 RepID=A0A2H3AZ82_9AGAR|nr:hypothetical protein ARMSODRAFT_1007356 [Armillaria solidipes]